jgi:hypothetical protein
LICFPFALGHTKDIIEYCNSESIKTTTDSKQRNKQQIMQSPWQTDFRDRKADLDFIRSERSTSAPPPETSFLFGTRNDGITSAGVDVSVHKYYDDDYVSD